jgi:hypothetical protein
MVHLCPRIALVGQTFGHGRDRQLVGVNRIDRVPGHRRRHLRTRACTHGPRAEDGLVRSVLVVVDEDASASFLLPPGRGEELRPAALELARDGDRRGPNLVRVPARLQPDVDMEAPVPGRLRVAGDPQLVEQAAKLGGRGAHAVEVDARLRIEVEPQLVRHVRLVVKVRPDVEPEAGQVDRPDHVRHVGEHQRAAGRPVRGAHDRRLQPLRRIRRHSLLEERASLCAVREPLHEGRPPAGRPQQGLGDGEVVAHQVELGLAALREEDLVRARDRQIASGNLDHAVLRHRANGTRG